MPNSPKASTPRLEKLEVRSAAPPIERDVKYIFSHLERTPENAHRGIWRDLACSKYEVTFPLYVEIICDLLGISTQFAAALPRLMPKAPRVCLETTDKPIIFVDSNMEKTIFFRPYRSADHTRFFIACQLGHIFLHLPKDAPGNYFVCPTQVPEDCMDQAAKFARSLLMPRGRVASERKSWAKNEGEKASEDLSRAFGVPSWAAARRLEDLHLV